MEKKTTATTTEKKRQKGRLPLTDTKGKRTAEDKKPLRKFWPTLFPYIKPYAKNMLLGAIFSLLVGACVSLQPLVIKHIVDSGIGNKPLSLFGKELLSFGADTEVSRRIRFIIIAAAIYVGLSLARVCFQLYGSRQIQKSMEGTLFTLRSKFFGHVQRMCMRFYDKNSAGELHNYIMGAPMTNIRNYLHSMTMGVPWQTASMVISLTVLISFNPVLTLIIFLTALAMALFNRMAWAKIRRYSKDFLAAEKQASHHITDTLHGSEAIKMYSIEDDAIDRFEGHLGALRDTGLRHSLFHSQVALKAEFVQYFGTGVVYLVGGICCVLGKIQVGELYLFLSTMTTMLNILNSWLGYSMAKNTAAVALDRVADIIDEHSTTPEVKESARRFVATEKASAIQNGKPCVSFVDVSFSYDTRPVFRGLSCDIRYGESVALVGESGSGKSTFTKLMMRLYEVDDGAVLIHDRNVKDYETHELRVSFGVVPQNPYIFYGTVWDNIRIVRPTATNKEIIDAMELARVHEFVNNLPLGWSTMIGDGALGLSGGQKQRIAIARAILKKPDIFIFDEATSALDNVSERLIQAAMEDLMRSHTVVMVAHRLSTIRNVDRILVFEKGEIVEEGNYDALAAKESGAFRTLLDAAEGKGEYEHIVLSH